MRGEEISAGEYGRGKKGVLLGRHSPDEDAAAKNTPEDEGKGRVE